MPNENDVLFHPEAADEYANSYAWYCGKILNVAEAFEREVKRSLRLIATYPTLPRASLRQTGKRFLSNLL